MKSRSGLWVLFAAGLAAIPQQVAAQGDKDSLYLQGRALEAAGRTSEAVRLYFRAARNSSTLAKQRLGELIARGDIPASLRLSPDGKSRFLGDRIEGGWGCPPKC